MTLRVTDCLGEVFDSSKGILIASNRFYFISTGQIALTSNSTPVCSLLLEFCGVNSAEGTVLRGPTKINNKACEAGETVVMIDFFLTLMSRISGLEFYC